jgi:hypothetical protein
MDMQLAITIEFYTKKFHFIVLSLSLKYDLSFMTITYQK